MTAEQFSNLAQTTLSASINLGATSLTVASATNFPTTGQFRIVVDAEIFLVTAVSGNTFTVTPGYEGTAQSAHISGATVAHVLTAGVIKTIAPGLRTVTASGVVAILPTDTVVEIAQTIPAACTVNIDPTTLIPGKHYTVVDIANMAATDSITLTPTSGSVIYQGSAQSNYVMNVNGMATTFYVNGINAVVIA